MKKYQVIITLDENGLLQVSAPIKDNIVLVIGMIEMAKDAVLSMHKSVNRRAAAITIPPGLIKMPPPKS